LGQEPLFANLVDEIVSQIEPICEQLETLPPESRIEALNRIREALHKVSPFQDEPVDLVLWKPVEVVDPNDYNPNEMQPPEEHLLEVSMEHHVTQPVVTSFVDGRHRIVDGEHRYLTIANSSQLSRLRGYVPVTVTNAETEAEHKAFTVQHNTRGSHILVPMVDLVRSLLQAGWEDDKIAEQLGMDADEILRLKQAMTAAEAFERPMFKRAWVTDNGQDEVDAP
jgi:hypothetical protein